MSFGKVSLVVLATVVIFATGVVTGGLLVRRTSRVEVAQPFWNRFEMTRRAVEHMPELTPEQRSRIDQIVRDNQELIADYFRILEPDVQQVFRKMRESIHEELTPDQRRRFEELAKRRALRPGERRLQEGVRPGSGQPGRFPPDGSIPRPPGRNGQPGLPPPDRPPPQP